MNSDAIRAMYTAVTQNDREKVSALLEQDPSFVNFESPLGTWLSVACSKGHLAMVQLLLDHGADPNQNSGVLNGNAVNMASSRGHLDIVKLLISKGGILDTSEPERNPLFGAIYNGHPNVARYLIDLGIDTTIAYTGSSMKNMDALAYAREWGRKDIEQMLLNPSH